MLYMGWMMDMKTPLPERVQRALEYYEKKYGRVPNVVEYSQQLNSEELAIPEVELFPINIPKNILYIGVRDE